MSLWEALGGAVAVPNDGSPDGRELASVFDGCGSRLARVVQARGFPMVVTQAYRLTRGHTANVLIDQILLDVEQLAASGEGQSGDAGVLVDLLRHLRLDPQRCPRLDIPADFGDVSMLEGTIAAELDRAEGGGFKPRPLSLDATCRKCSRSYYLAPELAAWWAGDRPARIVVTERTDLSSNRTYEFDAAAAPKRLVLYRALLALYDRSSRTA